MGEDKVISITDYEIVLKAVGDQTRARIMKLLEGNELCVCELMEVLGLSQSTVSEHLSLLKKAGLVSDRKEGRWSYFTLSDSKKNMYAPSMMALLMGWLDDDAQVRADKRKLMAILEKKKKETPDLSDGQE